MYFSEFNNYLKILLLQLKQSPGDLFMGGRRRPKTAPTFTAARALPWRDRFLTADQASLKSRALDARNEDDRRL